MAPYRERRALEPAPFQLHQTPFNQEPLNGERKKPINIKHFGGTEQKKTINIKHFGGTPPGVRPVCPGDTSHLSRDMSRLSRGHSVPLALIYT